MKVLCVIDDLGSGGAQRQLVNVARGLAARGHHLELFTYYAGAHFLPLLNAAGIRVHVREKTRRYSIAPVRELRRLIAGGGFDTVLAFLETPVVYSELATRGLRGVRLVVSERNTFPGGRVSVSRALKSQLHRAADAVVANTHTHRDWMARRFPFLAPKLSVIWNGVDLDEFRPALAEPRTGELRLLGSAASPRPKTCPVLWRRSAGAGSAGSCCGSTGSVASMTGLRRSQSSDS
jgi:glycosyltransferase involved in cell wall biosynthesis